MRILVKAKKVKIDDMFCRKILAVNAYEKDQLPGEYFNTYPNCTFCLIGGMESIAGVILMGPVIGVLETLTIQYLDPMIGGGLGEVVPYIVMLIVLVFKPYGLFGLKRIERI